MGQACSCGRGPGDDCLMVPSLTAFRKQVLEAHNEHRATHNTPPLKFDTKLNAQAQKWAKKLKKEGKEYKRFLEGSGEHADKTFGENLWTLSASGKLKVTGKYPCETWYEEGANYSYSNPIWNTDTGHFSQMIWKNSEKIGVGMVLSKDKKKIIVVANYQPPGNIEGQFSDNVPPAQPRSPPPPEAS